MKLLSIVFSVIIITTAMIGFCQSQSHYGQEFYFGMPHNEPTLCMELSLDIASLNAGNYSLRVPFLHMLDHGVIHKGLTNISIPCSLTKEGTFKENRGIFLKTNVFVAVYATNYYKTTAETFLVLPLEELGKNYCTAAYIPDSVEESYILVTAASNGTNVSIFNNSISKVIHNSSLNKLDLQQFSSTDDLQGVTVESDGPVSVVTGTSCTEIPQGFAACDMITEQMIPTDSFESVYIVPPTPPKQAHELRVTHVQNAINKTVCFYNMTRSFCRNDSTISVRMGSDPTVIVSSSPVGVFQYGYGNKYPLASIGDPFMTIIPGLGQFLNCYYFAIPSVYSNAQNHISIIIQNASLPGLSLDNKSLLVGTKFRVASPLQNYTVLNLNVSYGYHLVQHNDSNVKFGLLVYGLGEKTDTYVGYGYPGGMRLSNIASTTKITPADTAKANTTTTSTTTSQNKSGLTSTDNQSSMGDKNTGKQGIASTTKITPADTAKARKTTTSTTTSQNKSGLTSTDNQSSVGDKNTGKQGIASTTKITPADTAKARKTTTSTTTSQNKSGLTSTDNQSSVGDKNTGKQGIASTTKITPADTAKARKTTTSTTTSQNKSGLTSTDNQSSVGDKNTGKQGIASTTKITPADTAKARKTTTSTTTSQNKSGLTSTDNQSSVGDKNTGKQGIASTTKITPADTAKARKTTTSTTTSQNKSGLTSTDNQSSMGDKNTGKQSSGKDPLGSILGAVLGTAAAISLLACILYLFLWKKRGRKGKSSVEPER